MSKKIIFMHFDLKNYMSTHTGLFVVHKETGIGYGLPVHRTSIHFFYWWGALKIKVYNKNSRAKDDPNKNIYRV